MTLPQIQDGAIISRKVQAGISENFGNPLSQQVDLLFAKLEMHFGDLFAGLLPAVVGVVAAAAEQKKRS